MGVRNKQNDRQSESSSPEAGHNILQESKWFVLGALGLFLIVALLGFDKNDPGWSHAILVQKPSNPAGSTGAWIADLLFYLFGISAWWWVMLFLMFIWWGFRRLNALAERSNRSLPMALLGFLLLLLSSSALEALRFYSMAITLPLSAGGMVGIALGQSLADIFGYTGTTLLLLVTFAIGWSLFSGMSWLWFFEKTGTGLENAWHWSILQIEAWRDKRAGKVIALEREEIVELKQTQEFHEPVFIEPPPPDVPLSKAAEKRLVKEKIKEIQPSLFQESVDSSSKIPSLTLLDPAAASVETVAADTLEYTSRLIERKLSDFGVQIKVLAAMPGPVITRYEIEPAVGVKGAQVLNLAKDLARALSMVSIRVVETIPGKSCMALELPNPRRQMVKLHEILSSAQFNNMSSALTVALGKDISGQPVVADLAKMPHLLVAGTTGSGKSVGVNAMILSLIYKAEPSQVRLIMVDPKMLELSIYEGIPHLLAPVVTDMKQAANALNWCVGEMEKRYKLMSAMGVRNITGLNHKILEAEKREESLKNPFSLTPDDPEPLVHMPFIVVIIDELADLMMVVGKKVEELIARLAQKARASGIHLILATQRPSVDVITGLIKANIPTRIAFQVSSKIDSRTILEQMGAEALLGQGDMLYLAPGTGYPTRVHGAFVDDDEVHRVVDFLKSLGPPDYIDAVLESSGGDEETGEGGEAGGDDGEADALYDQAVEIVMKNQRASISLVQRHLRIGYNRSARLIEAMERAGLVSPSDGRGGREVLVKKAAE